jgi:diguanylate cyclase (GGDEF)-like protein
MLIEVHVFRQTERLAMVDGLTGVFNRRYMDIILKKEYNRCERYGKPLSVCLIDIDNFKLINDNHGHQFGDEVLREIASLLKAAVREEDIVCRYGGEEFLLILPETEAAGAFILANRIRSELKGDPFFRDNRITFSAGTSTFPSAALDITALVQTADRALYQAKFSGKDRVSEAVPERRKFGRFPQCWAVDVYPESSREPVIGIMTQNVSIGGIQFECPIRHAIDTPLRLVFTNIDPDIADVEAEARITWVKKHNDTYLYGVSFIDTPELIESKLLSRAQTLNEFA